MPKKVDEPMDSETRSVPMGKYGLSRSRGSDVLDLYQLDGELLRDAIARVVLQGDAILFGMTRDFSALKLQLLSSDGNEDIYVGTTRSLEDALRIVRGAQP